MINTYHRASSLMFSEAMANIFFSFELKVSTTICMVKIQL